MAHMRYHVETDVSRDAQPRVRMNVQAGTRHAAGEMADEIIRRARGEITAMAVFDRSRGDAAEPVEIHYLDAYGGTFSIDFRHRSSEGCDFLLGQATGLDNGVLHHAWVLLPGPGAEAFMAAEDLLRRKP